ncbi:MAG: methyltransferase domain-containing protein [Rubrivivax sp.]|nr:methyltransferase domain-containing protein [Rubrivivax sp.]
MSAAFEQARAHFMAGLQAQEAGQLDEAGAAYRASLVQVPGRASTLNNLGVVLAALGRDDEALPCFEQSLAAEAADASTWVLLGQCQARLGQLNDALLSADRALGHAPELAAAWALRGGVLKDLGRHREAAVALRKAMDLGADPSLQAYLLASIEGRNAPPQAPPHYVEQLFDGYADSFDQHLVQGLEYRVPEALVQLLRQHKPNFNEVLDLGCGTGLCGPLLRPLAQRLVGVDLSAGMLRHARQAACYDQLVQTDVARHLHTTDGRPDAIVAADVFIYIGDLDAVFAGVRRVLKPGGLLAFSVEAADDTVDFELRPSSRYAQSARYVQALAQRHGLVVEQQEQTTLRLDQRQPVAGLLFLLSAS